MEAKLYSINGQSVANARSDFTSRGCQLVESSRHKLHLSSIEMAEQWVHKFINTTQEDICITWKVTSVETKPRTTSPPVPFKTSTLQMEASSKLGWSISRTMRVAQELYESGCISYMRTDNVQLSPEAKQAASQAVIARFGTEHVATNSSFTTTHRTTSKKQKKNQNSQFAQEAHEAIRPSILENGTFRTPKEVESTVPNLSSSAVLLYKLIYQRTLAHRMHPRITNHTSVMIEGRRRTINSNSVDDDVLQFRATGFVVVYPGYSLAYNEDDNGNDSSSQKLPKNLAAGQALDLQELAPLQHTTQPPPRFTEATLVKELESLGVGRPSTYASVIQLLRDRAYVMSKTPFGEAYQPPRHMSIAAGSISAVRAAGGEVVFAGGAGGSKSGPLIPSLTAFVVCDLLQKHCPTYIDPTFTASMEDRLDRIARGDESLSGEEQRIAYLSEFYAGEHGLAAQIKRIDETVDPYKARRANLPSLLDKDDDGSNSDSQQPAVGVFVGPWGPYIRWMPKNDDGNATTIPTDNENEDVKRHSVQLPAELAADIPSIKSSALRALLSTKEVGGDVLGAHPEDGRSIRLKTGRFGAYLQWGDDGAEGTTTHSLPRNRATMRKQNDEATSHEERSLGSMLGITLEEAIGYVSLPRTVGTLHGLPITCALGPYGPYLKYNSTYTSLSENDGDVLSIDEETAMKIVTERIIETTKTGLGRGVVANLGEKEDGNVVVKSGRFGKFLNWKNVNVKLPSEYLDNPEEIPLEVAWSLIQVRGKKSGSTTGKKRKQHVLSKAVDIPAPPKRPLSAYLHFCATNRPAVAANSTKSLTAPELSKTLASLWAELNSEERAVYNEMSAKSRDDYDNQRKRWEEEYSNINGNKKNKKTFQNGEIRPKKSKSAYLFFCAAKRPEVAETVKTLGEISKELARRWAETEDRTEYEEMAAADKRRYEEECTALKSSAKTKGTKDNESSASTPRAPSAYMLFCREMRPSIVDEHGEKLPFADTTKKLAMMWKECSEDTRERFHNLAKQGKMETSGPPMG
jgi:DNA topoisomerase-1